ncbi:hypothetical protein SAMN04487926_101499 [Paraburkholderia steynii]|uniref:Uncharacterized protein n=1 Tax=Paraburkholderia steynii TaxID=1245441 RepID=A0A7Z7B0E3_9BURK|nr:hypothetical protein SAMN04487926_101499 [Paraburkholderia steynii]
MSNLSHSQHFVDRLQRVGYGRWGRLGAARSSASFELPGSAASFSHSTRLRGRQSVTPYNDKEIAAVNAASCLCMLRSFSTARGIDFQLCPIVRVPKASYPVLVRMRNNLAMRFGQVQVPEPRYILQESIAPLLQRSHRQFAR